MVEGDLAVPVPAQRCPQCGGEADLRTRHVVIEGNLVRTYCSADCASSSTLPSVPAIEAPPRRRRFRFAGLSLVPALLFMSGRENRVEPLPPARIAAVVVGAPAATASAPDPAQFGPHWPPTDQDWLAEIQSDAWIHPLDGPERRMPISDSRVFGAERQGDRPGECRNGHCGVDLSGPWGEPVHAVHDGIVDRVQRGPNEEHGGLYVRIAHRDGTIFSQYFHLAAIPRQLEPGVRVKVGEVIGLLGDSGVKHSAAHLHFTLSVRPAANLPEKYMDPEPLIALWPLRFRIGESSAVVAAQVPPGVPHGAAPNRKHKASRRASAAALPAAPSGDDGAVAE